MLATYFLQFFTPPPLPFLENQLFFEGGGLKNVTSVDHVFFTSLTPPLFSKIICFFERGGGCRGYGNGEVVTLRAHHEPFCVISIVDGQSACLGTEARLGRGRTADKYMNENTCFLQDMAV